MYKWYAMFTAFTRIVLGAPFSIACMSYQQMSCFAFYSHQYSIHDIQVQFQEWGEGKKHFIFSDESINALNLNEMS